MAAVPTAASILDEDGSVVRSVQASCEVPVPENAMAGRPSFAASKAAPLHEAEISRLGHRHGMEESEVLTWSQIRRPKTRCYLTTMDIRLEL